MTTTRRLAMLIDGDNAQAALLDQMLAETGKYGIITIRRVYGDWTEPQMKSWKQTLNTHALQPVQQFRYTVGKNATDSAMIIDAMDVLYTAGVDGFCLVSSDSDYTRLATRIREKNMFVMGIGKAMTPRAFVNACDVFVYTENLVAEETLVQLPPQAPTQPKKRRKTAATSTAGAIEQAVAPSTASLQNAPPAKPKKAAKAAPVAQTPAAKPKKSRRAKSTAPTDPTPHIEKPGQSAASLFNVEPAPTIYSVDDDDYFDRDDIDETDSILDTPILQIEPIPVNRRVKVPKVTPPPVTELNIETLFRTAFEQSVGEDGWAHLGSMGNKLRQLDPGFDSRTYGYRQLSSLIEAHPEIFEIRKTEPASTSAIYVRLHDAEKLSNIKRRTP